MKKKQKTNSHIKPKDFIYVYNLLNKHHKHIVLQTLFLMERDLSHHSMNENIYKEIKNKQEELGIGYSDLYKKICDMNGYNISKKTYESVIRRKTISNSTFEDICRIVNLKENNIEHIKLQSQFNDQVNIEWLFDSLSTKNKNAIYTLSNLLHIEETLPESFGDDFFNEE